MKYKVTLRNKTYEVEVEHGEAMIVDEYAAYAPAAPAAPVAAAPAAPAAAAAPAAPAAGGTGGEIVKSPMPGNILDIKVKAGDTVKAGQILVILEAMKMENEIVAPCDGTVAEVFTSKGAVVDTGAQLVALSNGNSQYVPAAAPTAAPAVAPAAPAAAPAAPAPAAAPAPTAAGETVSAPMPGNILDVKVKAGDAVKAGQVLVILEAMKMENEIVAPHDGTVAEVVTSKGAVVDTGAPLVVIG